MGTVRRRQRTNGVPSNETTMFCSYVVDRLLAGDLGKGFWIGVKLVDDPACLLVCANQDLRKGNGEVT